MSDLLGEIACPWFPLPPSHYNVCLLLPTPTYKILKNALLLYLPFETSLPMVVDDEKSVRVSVFFVLVFYVHIPFSFFVTVNSSKNSILLLIVIILSRLSWLLIPIIFMILKLKAKKKFPNMLQKWEFKMWKICLMNMSSPLSVKDLNLLNLKMECTKCFWLILVLLLIKRSLKNKILVCFCFVIFYYLILVEFWLWIFFLLMFLLFQDNTKKVNTNNVNVYKAGFLHTISQISLHSLVAKPAVVGSVLKLIKIQRWPLVICGVNPLNHGR